MNEVNAMPERDRDLEVNPAGEAGAGTVPGDHLGAGGVTGGTGRHTTGGGAPPRSEALGAYGTGTATRDEEDEAPEGGLDTTPHGLSRGGETMDEHTVVQEAEWGKTSGAPSGGVAGGKPAGE